MLDFLLTNFNAILFNDYFVLGVCLLFLLAFWLASYLSDRRYPMNLTDEQEKASTKQLLCLIPLGILGWFVCGYLELFYKAELIKELVEAGLIVLP